MDSRTVAFTRILRRISFKSWIQSRAFNLWRWMLKNQVFNNQPSTVLILSGIPSPSGLGVLVASARGSGLSGSFGRNLVWTANGAAF